MNTDKSEPIFSMDAGHAVLPHWGVIRAAGDDASSFLHGQITHDVALLPSGRARYAGYCNAQGRLQANFVLWKQGADIWIAAPTEVIEALIKRWRMFVLRAKCVFEDLSSSHAVTGVWGAAADGWLGEGDWAVRPHGAHVAIRLPDAEVGAQRVARALIVGTSAPSLTAAAAPAHVWDWLDIHAGLGWVTTATAGQFVPQMINMESLDGVSFKKGCYPGQEVVARSQFRGAIKRRAERIRSAAAIAAGQEVFANGQAVGVVVNAASAPDGGYAGLVSIHVGESEGQTLHIGGADGPQAERLGLPYALLTDI